MQPEPQVFPEQPLFDHILKMAVSFYDRNPVGRLMARVESDTEALRQMFTNTVVNIIGTIIQVVGIFIILLIISPKLALIVMAFIPIIIGMAGNVGTQSLTIVVRGLATRRIDVKKFWGVVLREIVVGVLLGLLYGAALGAMGFFQLVFSFIRNEIFNFFNS